MLLPLISLVALLGAVQTRSDTAHCARAAQFLRTTQQMVAAVETDTIDDWRTGTRAAGCRVTSAGGTDIGVAGEAVRLYERLRAAQWVRTPDPRDSPHEASLRFRFAQSDCLFNVNAEAMLNTDAELRVNTALLLTSGRTRYQVFVMCMAAMPAKPR